MRSKIFQSRGDQIIKELRVQNETDFEEWIPRDKEVKVIIDSHKSDPRMTHGPIHQGLDVNPEGSSNTN